MTTTREVPRIWIVGNPNVGKKSFIAALGGTARRTSQDPAIAEYAWSGRTIAVCSDATRWRGECERHDVVVLLFDLTHRESFQAIVAEWATLVSAQTHTLLVGTKLDRAAERQVTTSEIMELALVECDDFVEVCASHPPFQGVVYARQLLATWVNQEESSPQARTSLHSSSSRKQKLGVHSSVWLYDPTEEVEVAGHDDVKLRPISRALFEMREAGSDRTKTQERRREHAVAKIVTRSRYHGPTESSRSMRWQAHQLQLQQQNARISHRRKSVSDAHVTHSKLEHKSFLQPTKLMQHRVDEIRHRVLANLEKPVSSKRPGRQRAQSTAPPPPAPVAQSPLRPRAPSLTLSPTKSPQLRCTARSPIEAASDEVALDLFSPPLAPLVAPAPSSPLMPSSVEDKNSKNQELPSTKENQHDIRETNQHDDREDLRCANERVAVATEIDDMLDYFDGVTLPL